ncbi:SDR family NAD(P)-dependent oxidoreductase [Sandaracinobacteroides saxicola]|uniref:SDR family oxidoreductase n=1 Tax=Sandaracinobacteroides saxicola TaxID=2759707 RepID=A0A7G5IF95_9SPHN|nr:SDR family NAD(P)-dependent oxidoreductase [Sandaracinobacteroides saxicola]QMW22037.1 SDR family oxidoreductase [Sandaracinobacteroides saxicola]
MTGKGSIAIVGAGDFIGAAIARRFAREGHPVHGGRRRAERQDALADSIAATGGRYTPHRLDARLEDEVVAFLDAAEADAPLDAVIFNIGANVRFALTDTTERVFRKVWEMACAAGFLTTREAARRMLPRGRGAIFLTGATASVRGASHYAAFASAKAGLRAVAQSAARELGAQGIHVAHLIIDGGVDTDFVRERIRETGRDPETLPPDTLLRPETIADTYWTLFNQPRDAWTFELDLRPFSETW